MTNRSSEYTNIDMETREGKDILHAELSYKIVGTAYEVFNELGPGLKEKVYQSAMAVGLTKNGLKFVEQYPVNVSFQGISVGRRYLDFVVEDTIVVELKAGEYAGSVHVRQANEYLKATGFSLALILCFALDGVRQKRVLNIKGHV